MKITVKLFSSLMDYLPDNIDGNTLKLTVSDGQTPVQILDRYKIPHEEAQMMMCNGVFLPAEKRDQPLQEGDSLSIWPTIQGG
jgi:sulfur carrier protein ThiS